MEGPFAKQTLDTGKSSIFSHVPFFVNVTRIAKQAFKHVFTSPSSVEHAPKATRQGNAKLHNMTKVNIPSLAYIATQVDSVAQSDLHCVDVQQLKVRFALSSASVFTRSDTEFDSARFYNSLMTFLEDPAEKEEVNDLLLYWNQYVF